MFNKTAELDAFAEIKQKISQVETERKEIEIAMQTDLHAVMRRFSDFDFKFEQNEKVFQ